MKLIGKSLRLSYIGVIMILNHNIRLSTQSIFSECVNVTKFFSGVVGFFGSHVPLKKASKSLPPVIPNLPLM